MKKQQEKQAVIFSLLFLIIGILLGCQDPVLKVPNSFPPRPTHTVFASTSGTLSGNQIGTVEITFPDNVDEVDPSSFTIKVGNTNPPTTVATISKMFFVGSTVYATINKSIALGDYVSVKLDNGAVTSNNIVSPAIADPFISPPAIHRAPKLIAVLPLKGESSILFAVGTHTEIGLGKIGFLFDKVLGGTIDKTKFKTGTGARGSSINTSATVFTSTTIVKGTDIITESSGIRKFVSSTSVNASQFDNYIVQSTSITNTNIPKFGEDIKVELLAEAVSDTASQKSIDQSLIFTNIDELAPKFIKLTAKEGKTIILTFDEPIKEASIDLTKITITYDGSTLDLSSAKAIAQINGTISSGESPIGKVLIIRENNTSTATGMLDAGKNITVGYSAGAFVGATSHLEVAALASGGRIFSVTATNTSATTGPIANPALFDVRYVNVTGGTSFFLFVFDNVAHATNAIATGANYEYAVNSTGTAQTVQGVTAIGAANVPVNLQYVSVKVPVQTATPVTSGDLVKATLKVGAFKDVDNSPSRVDGTGIKVSIP